MMGLDLEKCCFITSKVGYFGLIVKPKQLTMNLVKLDGIASWSTSIKVKGVHSFFGCANFYQQFIPDYSNAVHFIIDITKKNLLVPTCQSTFETLETLFLSKSILYLLDLSIPFAITTYASKYVSGAAILLQTNSNGDWHSCSSHSYFSPLLS